MAPRSSTRAARPVRSSARLATRQSLIVVDTPTASNKPPRSLSLPAGSECDSELSELDDQRIEKLEAEVEEAARLASGPVAIQNDASLTVSAQEARENSPLMSTSETLDEIEVLPAPALSSELAPVSPSDDRGSVSASDAAVDSGIEMKPLSPPISEDRHSQTEPGSTLVHWEGIDPALIAVSKAMTDRSGIRPATRGQPRVWAASRQALYETLPYFKKPQGGCHQNDNHTYSFLYDGIGQCGEYTDSDVIIGRAGGGMDAEGGSYVVAKNRDFASTQPRAVLNDLQLQNPLVIISGNKNSLVPATMPHRYNVLGWFKPTFVWCEKVRGKRGAAHTMVKYRFERLNRDQPAWFAPANDRRQEMLQNLPPGAQERIDAACIKCRATYPQVYLEGWMCLDSACDNFWMDASGADAGIDDKTYHPSFLLYHHRWQDETEPYDVRPPVPEIGKAIGDNYTYLNTRGVVCPDCGRCNSRYHFSRWVCDNPKCSWTGISPNLTPLERATVHSPWDTIGNGPTLTRNKHVPGVEVQVSYVSGYKVLKYTFPGIEGYFIHAVANDAINRQRLGPDEMFATLQQQEIGLQRRRFRVVKNSGKAPTVPRKRKRAERDDSSDSEDDMDNTDLQDATDKPAPEAGDFMTAFSINVGMPYKFVASGASLPFESTCWPIRAARSQLEWAARTLIPSTTGPIVPEFNECLVLGYMENQKMEYHDDGEEGLGPTIASLSVGCKSKMKIRMKAKHFTGFSKSGVLTPDRPVLTGNAPEDIARHEKRLEMWSQLQPYVQAARESSKDQGALKAKLRELGAKLKGRQTTCKPGPDLVEITLGFGDIMIMHGHDIQKYLEHKVAAEGLVRFVFTCRTVLPGHLKTDELPTYPVGPDPWHYDGHRLTEADTGQPVEDLSVQE